MRKRGTWKWDADAGHGQSRRIADLRGILLRLAAYRAVHDGREPPPNSALAREKEFLLDIADRPSPWGRLLRPFRRGGRFRPGTVAPANRPLPAYLVERAFLTDDFTEADVIRRLEAWPMIGAYRFEGRAETGEWFLFTMQVRAENARQASMLVDCIFAVDPPPPPDLNLPEA